MAQFIIENLYDDSKLEFLTESDATGSKKLYLEGPMVMCNRKNRNGRMYDLESVGRPAVDRYNTTIVMDNRAIGEVEHPDYPFPKLSKAATMIHNPLLWDGDNAVGKMEVLNNQQGQIIRSLVEARYHMAVSTRGLGESKKQNGTEMIKPGYFITAVDVVDTPSGQVCYMNAITESIDWVQHGDIWVPTKVNENADIIIKSGCDELIRRFESVMKHLS